MSLVEDSQLTSSAHAQMRPDCRLVQESAPPAHPHHLQACEEKAFFKPLKEPILLPMMGSGKRAEQLCPAPPYTLLGSLSATDVFVGSHVWVEDF